MTKAYRVGAVTVIVFGVCAAVASYRLSLGSLSEPGSGLWPFLVSAVAVFAGVVLVFEDTSDDYEPWTRNKLRIVAAFAALGLFIVLFGLVSFVVPAFAFLLLWLRYFADEPWKLAIILAFVGAIAVYLIFGVLLGVPFPAGFGSRLTGMGAGLSWTF